MKYLLKKSGIASGGGTSQLQNIFLFSSWVFIGDEKAPNENHIWKRLKSLAYVFSNEEGIQEWKEELATAWTAAKADFKAGKQSTAPHKFAKQIEPHSFDLDREALIYVQHENRILEA